VEVLVIKRKTLTKSIFTIEEDDEEDRSVKSSKTGDFIDHDISDIINMSIKS
jgi:hypothetical protein